jgi:hypothetical protein
MYGSTASGLLATHVTMVSRWIVAYVPNYAGMAVLPDFGCTFRAIEAGKHGTRISTYLLTYLLACLLAAVDQLP